jgi:hypothetical protein
MRTVGRYRRVFLVAVAVGERLLTELIADPVRRVIARQPYAPSLGTAPRIERVG